MIYTRIDKHHYVFDLREFNQDRVVFFGDIHGKVDRFRELLDEVQPTIAVQVGDFHLELPQCLGKVKKALEGIHIPIIFIGGNHDHWDYLDEVEESGNLEIVPNLYYAPRNSIIKLSQGRDLLMLGGAKSPDFKDRIWGLEWFPQEELSHEDYYNFPETDIYGIISHTCTEPILTKVLDGVASKNVWPDYSEKVLSEAKKKYNPKLWVFGHMHHYVRGFEESGLEWCCLSGIEMHSKNHPCMIKLGNKNKLEGIQ